MKNLASIPFFLAILLLLNGCSSDELGPEPKPEDYNQSFQEWQEHRIDVLTDTTGWLRLVDLIWFDEGENSFGSSPESDIRFPEGSIPENGGTFILQNGEVVMEVADGVEIYHDGEQVDSLVMLEHENEGRIHAHHGDLTWFIDSRGEQRGVKIFSMDTPAADQFYGFPRYDLQEEWHLRGRFVNHPEDKDIEVVNVQGETIQRSSPGYVEFRIDEEKYFIDAFEASNGLFLMFTDLTNQDETYQAGRYLMVDSPSDDGYITLDFNKTYNPPCAFSKFTTCQLPPPQNRLDVAIPAGEKRPADFEGI